MAQHVTLTEFQTELREHVALPREEALEEIKRRLGADFHGWFNEVYKLRSAGKQDEYEKVIFEKLELLTKNTTFEVEIQEGNSAVGF